MTELETFAANPDSWPTFPFLPLVNRKVREANNFLKMGVAFCHPCELAPKPILYKVGLHRMPSSLEEFEALPKETFENFAAMAAAGWEVD